MVGGPLGVDCFSEAGFNCMVPTCSCRSKCRKKCRSKCRKKIVRTFFPLHSVRVWPGRQGGKGPGKKGPAREEMIRSNARGPPRITFLLSSDGGTGLIWAAGRKPSGTWCTGNGGRRACGISCTKPVPPAGWKQCCSNRIIRIPDAQSHMPRKLRAVHAF